MDLGLIYIALAIIFGLFMAWGVGANNVANLLGTSVGSRAISFKQALIVVIIFEIAGAVFAGSHVTATIQSEIIHTAMTDQFIYGMLAALLAASTWILIASYYGSPVSTTQSIIGALIGFAAVCISINSVNWQMIAPIFLSWLITPLIACGLAYLFFESMQKLIFNTHSPFLKAKRYAPYYAFFITMLISMVILTHDFAAAWVTLLSLIISSVVTFVCWLVLQRIHYDPNAHFKNRFAMVEKIFGVLMIFSTAAMAFAHGSNDVANAIGPVAAVINIVKHDSAIPFWTLLLGAIGIVSGLALYGHRLLTNFSTHISQLTPSRGLCAQLATATVVIVASSFGMPVSTTQILIGAILGLGFARGMGALNINIARKILVSWLITLPASAILAVVYYYIVMELFIDVYGLKLS